MLQVDRLEKSQVNLEAIAGVIVDYVRGTDSLNQSAIFELIINCLSAEKKSYEDYGYSTALYHRFVGNAQIAEQLGELISELNIIHAKKINKDEKDFDLLDKIKGFFSKGEWKAWAPKTKLIIAILAAAKFKIVIEELITLLATNSGKDFNQEFELKLSRAREKYNRELAPNQAETEQAYQPRLTTVQRPCVSPICDGSDDHQAAVAAAGVRRKTSEDFLGGFSAALRSSARALVEALENAQENHADPNAGVEPMDRYGSTPWI
jgi:hypothetical protein